MSLTFSRYVRFIFHVCPVLSSRVISLHLPSCRLVSLCFVSLSYPLRSPCFHFCPCQSGTGRPFRLGWRKIRQGRSSCLVTFWRDRRLRKVERKFRYLRSCLPQNLRSKLALQIVNQRTDKGELCKIYKPHAALDNGRDHIQRYHQAGILVVLSFFQSKQSRDHKRRVCVPTKPLSSQFGPFPDECL